MKAAAPKMDEVTVRVNDGPAQPFAARFDLRSHSLDDFEWGYSGSGPAQLALALAADVLVDDERVQDIYQDLQFKLGGRLAKDTWSPGEEEIRAVLEQLQRQRESRNP